MSLMKQASDEELEGVKAIQFGLAQSNKKEPEWVSLNTWRALYPDEKEYILHVYHTIRREMEEDAERKEEGTIQTTDSPSEDGDRGRELGEASPLD